MTLKVRDMAAAIPSLLAIYSSLESTGMLCFPFRREKKKYDCPIQRQLDGRGLLDGISMLYPITNEAMNNDISTAEILKVFIIKTFTRCLQVEGQQEAGKQEGYRGEKLEKNIQIHYITVPFFHERSLLFFFPHFLSSTLSSDIIGFFCFPLFFFAFFFFNGFYPVHRSSYRITANFSFFFFVFSQSQIFGLSHTPVTAS
jgi:hypothetical protein